MIVAFGMYSAVHSRIRGPTRPLRGEDMAAHARPIDQPVFHQASPWQSPGRWLLLGVAMLSLSSLLFN